MLRKYVMGGFISSSLITTTYFSNKSINDLLHDNHAYKDSYTYKYLYKIANYTKYLLDKPTVDIVIKNSDKINHEHKMATLDKHLLSGEDFNKDIIFYFIIKMFKRAAKGAACGTLLFGMYTELSVSDLIHDRKGYNDSFASKYLYKYTNYRKYLHDKSRIIFTDDCMFKCPQHLKIICSSIPQGWPGLDFFNNTPKNKEDIEATIKHNYDIKTNFNSGLLLSGSDFNILFPNTYKIKYINSDFKHFNMDYSVAKENPRTIIENIEPMTPLSKCDKGGMHFYNKLHEGDPDKIAFGKYIADVIIPDDAYVYMKGSICKTDKFILSNIRSRADDDVII